MKKYWFKRKFLFYFPVTASGWMLAAAILVFAVYSFIAIDKRSHSVSDTLMNFVFRMLIVYLVFIIAGYLTGITKTNNHL